MRANRRHRQSGSGRASAPDYLANLASQSGTRALRESRRAWFLTRVRQRLAALESPSLTATFVGNLAIGRRA